MHDLVSAPVHTGAKCPLCLTQWLALGSFSNLLGLSIPPSTRVQPTKTASENVTKKSSYLARLSFWIEWPAGR
jgi:hypothetical protein